MRILLTGGCGYIGSHLCLSLMEEKHEVVIVDNLSRSTHDSTGKIAMHFDNKRTPVFYSVDLLDLNGLRNVFMQYRFDVVVHLAGFKSVGESSDYPLKYFHNNIGGTLNLLKVMEEFECFNLIFSSSATVYGNPKKVPIVEESPLESINPYGSTKLKIEEILKELAQCDFRWRIVSLRYFNPVGAHFSGVLSEDPDGQSTNLFPVLYRYVNKGNNEYRGLGESGNDSGSGEDVFTIFGNDYGTKDGTCVRDYIYIMDLVSGHQAAIDYLDHLSSGYEVFNLGTGKGYTVLEVIDCFNILGLKINYNFTDRRLGDAESSYADVSKAKRKLGWQAKYVLGDMVKFGYKSYCINKEG